MRAMPFLFTCQLSNFEKEHLKSQTGTELEMEEYKLGAEQGRKT